jgi:hypothetical protein
MGNWHLFLAGLLAGIGLMLLGAILAHAFIYGF